MMDLNPPNSFPPVGLGWGDLAAGVACSTTVKPIRFNFFALDELLGLVRVFDDEVGLTRAVGSPSSAASAEHVEAIRAVNSSASLSSGNTETGAGEARGSGTEMRDFDGVTDGAKR